MTRNFRRFQAGPDPFGRVWHVDFLWLQTAVSIRHSDSVDVKFLLTEGATRIEKVISLPHTALTGLSRSTGRPLTDAWCASLASLHIRTMIETGEDWEKGLVSVPFSRLARHVERCAL
jgi:hypothetical protein